MKFPIELWKTKNKDKSWKSLVVFKESWWKCHWMNRKFHFKYHGDNSPSKVHANIQFLVIGFGAWNGGADIRLFNISIRYQW